MSCLRVRDRLAEYALGVLPPSEAAEVERHLQWCTGCRKEVAELEEGLAAVALGLPERDPPAHLEAAVVHRVTGASGRRLRPSRSGFRALLAAALAAVMVAGGALGWAVAEKRRADDIQKAAQGRVQQLERLRDLLASFPRGKEGVSLQADLRPVAVAAGRGFGKAVIYSAPGQGVGLDDWVVVDVVPPGTEGPYTVELVDGSGKVLAGGSLKRTDGGDWIYMEILGVDLARVTAVHVRGPSGRLVLTGPVHR